MHANYRSSSYRFIAISLCECPSAGPIGCGFGEAPAPDSSKDRWGHVREEATLAVAVPSRLFAEALCTPWNLGLDS